MKIETRTAVVRFGATTALNGVDVSVDGGELVGFIGPNGSGKTTLLRVLAGLLTPDSGSAFLAGQPSASIDKSEFARSVSYLQQGAEVHWPITIESLVGLGRLPHRRAFRGPTDQDRQAVERALMATDTHLLRRRTVNQVSGGERMRALLARALAVEAPMLLADEPVAALDPLHQLQVMDLLRAKVAAGGGVVVVLHDLSLAARYCDRLVLMSKGAVLADGRPADVLSDDNVATAFGVEVARGSHEGVPIITPWKPLTGEDHANAG
jgi:iron complex transport system ATP-binding protein